MEHLQLLQHLKKNPMTPANYHRLIDIVEHMAKQIVDMRSKIEKIRENGVDE